MPAPDSTASAPTAVPLCVDLDGTLIHSDLLWESFASVLRTRPRRALLVPWWFLHGRAHLKQQLAVGTVLDVARLPYNAALLDLIHREKSRGRAVLLVTASDRDFARKVGDYVGLFDEVLGSDGVNNLRGELKAATLAQRFGERGYDYAGNSSPDLPVWARAHGALVVNAPPGLARRARAEHRVLVEIPGPPNTGFVAWVELLRPLRWTGNLVILAPWVVVPLLPIALFGASSGKTPTGGASAFAFVAFCLGGSGISILDDVLNLESDRRDPVKARRPLAAGRTLISMACLAGLALCSAGLGLAALASTACAAVLAVYLVVAAAYVWRLRHFAWVGAVVFAVLGSLKIFGGFTTSGSGSLSFFLSPVTWCLFVGLVLGRRFLEPNKAKLAP